MARCTCSTATESRRTCDVHGEGLVNTHDEILVLLQKIHLELKNQTNLLQGFANAPKPDPKQAMEEAMKLVSSAGFGHIIARMNKEGGGS